MGRLDNIIARNQRAGRPRERTVVTLVFGCVLLLILGLMMFTDLGTPPAPPKPEPVRRVDGVLLRSAPARDAGHDAAH